jgi:cysteine desulfurase / selenocysteine lyase
MHKYKNIREDFLILKRNINSKPIVYLDSTASTLKPQTVIDKIQEYYTKYSVNIFRGVYSLSEEATGEYEKAREKVATFIGCPDPREIIFVRNATEALNLVMQTLGRQIIDVDSEILTTLMEHHANFVTWQVLAKEKKAKIIYIDFNSDYTFDINKMIGAVNEKTKIVAFTHVSNVLGTINPVKQIVAAIKKKNPKVIIIIDGAQAVPHMKVDVADLGCDFYVFSGHKMLGPTGIGVLWGKYALLDSMPPYQFGGEMIKDVGIEGTVYQKPPFKFEAGTPHIAGVIGLGAAVDYLTDIGMEQVRQHEKEMTKYALEKLASLNYVTVYGPTDAQIKGGVIAFTMKDVHPHDVASILDRTNICIRTGHHCAMPLHKRLQLGATCRASFYIYNTKEEVDILVEELEKVAKLFKVI